MLGLYVPKEKKLTIHFSQGDFSNLVKSSRKGDRVSGFAFSKSNDVVQEYSLEAFNSRRDLVGSGLVVYNDFHKDFGIAIAPSVISELQENNNEYRTFSFSGEEVKSVVMRVWTNDKLYDLLSKD